MKPISAVSADAGAAEGGHMQVSGADLDPTRSESST